MRTLSAFRPLSLVVLLCAAFLLAAFSPAPAHANGKYAGIVIDAKTGRTLYSHKADATRYPASLTKMMTLYMMFEALEEGRLKKKTRIRMSKYAASKPPSKLGIRAGRTLSAEQAIYALVTKSANDVAAAVAEHLGGSESNFGVMMTRKARELGMKSTTFKNASGLTARGQVTTARDMARLGLALREHFPQHYRYFSTRSFKYGKRRYGNHNRLLGRVRGVDGIKTGYTRASGFNLVSSVQANKRSIVAVVLGGRTGKSRNAQMQKLISRYLRKASRGPQKQLLASRKSSNVVLASAIKLPKYGPIPVFRARATVTTVADKRLDSAHQTQHASVMASAGKPFREGTGYNVEEIRSYLMSLKGKSLPVPSERPEVPAIKPQEIITASVVPVAKAEKPAPKPVGWVIQIGASDSRSGALSLLEKARTKAPGTLKGKEIYTETVEKGDAVLHRARFTGFASKSDAWKACKTLKRKRFACLALQS